MAAIVESYMQECAKRRVEPYYGFIEHVDAHAIDSDIDFVNAGHLRVLFHVLNSCDDSSLLALRLARGQRRDVQHPPVKSQQLVSYRKLLRQYGSRELDSQTLTKMTIAVAHVLKISPYLNELHLVGIPFGSAGARRLSESVNFAMHLQSVDVSGSAIGDEGAALLLPALCNMAHLNELSLAECELTDASAAAVGKLLGANRQKESTDLWTGSLRGGTSGRGGGNDTPSTLHSLDVSRNYFGNALAKTVQTHLLYDVSITALNFSDNTIGKDGAVALVSLLACNSAIQSMDLSGNTHAVNALAGTDEEVVPGCRIIATGRCGSGGCVIVRNSDVPPSASAYQDPYAVPKPAPKRNLLVKKTRPAPKRAATMPKPKRTIATKTQPVPKPKHVAATNDEEPLSIHNGDGADELESSTKRKSTSRSPNDEEPLDVDEASGDGADGIETPWGATQPEPQPLEQEHFLTTESKQPAPHPFPHQPLHGQPHLAHHHHHPHHHYGHYPPHPSVMPAMAFYPPPPHAHHAPPFFHQHVPPPSTMPTPAWAAWSAMTSGIPPSQLPPPPQAQDEVGGHNICVKWDGQRWVPVDIDAMVAQKQAQTLAEKPREKSRSPPNPNQGEVENDEVPVNMDDLEKEEEDAAKDAEQPAGLGELGVPDEEKDGENDDDEECAEGEDPDARAKASPFVSPEVQKYFGEILDVYEAHMVQQTKHSEAQLRKQTETLRMLERKLEQLQLRPVLPPKRETRVVMVKQEDYPGQNIAAEQMEGTLRSLLDKLEDTMELPGAAERKSQRDAAAAAKSADTKPKTSGDGVPPVGTDYSAFLKKDPPQTAASGSSAKPSTSKAAGGEELVNAVSDRLNTLGW